MNDFALLHLSHPVNITSYVEPVCLPNFGNNNDDLDPVSLRTQSVNSSIEELALTGWNRQNPINIFLRLKIQNESICSNLWELEPETNLVPFNSSSIWCSTVGYGRKILDIIFKNMKIFNTSENHLLFADNHHNVCIHNNVGAVAAVREVGGLFYVAGIVKELYSWNRERKCYQEHIIILMSYLKTLSSGLTIIESKAEF